MIFAFAAFVAACASFDEYTIDDACDDVGVAFANKALECTSDPARANDAYEAFVGRYHCGPPTTVEQAIDCQGNVLSAQCPPSGRFDDDDIDTIASRCTFAVDLGPDHGCSLLAKTLDEPSNGPYPCVAPPGGGTWGAFFADHYTCSPSATIDTIRVCRSSLNCAGGGSPITLLSLDSCSSIVSPTGDVDVCDVLIGGAAALMRSGACGNGTDAYADQFEADLRSHYGCPRVAAFSDVVARCSQQEGFCPSVQYLGESQPVTVAGETDAVLAFEVSVQPQCAALLGVAP